MSNSETDGGKGVSTEAVETNGGKGVSTETVETNPPATQTTSA